MGDSNPAHCPLYDVRKLPLEEALDWAAGLSTDDKAFLLQYHRCCLAHLLEEQRAAREKARKHPAPPAHPPAKHRT